jgi:hypothetical protein
MAELYRLDFSNGKSYIGITETTALKRFAGHQAAVRKGRTTPVHCAWRKYGEPKLTVLAILEKGLLAATEIEAIKLFKTLSPHGYNLSFGGDLGPASNPEVAAKIAAALTGNPKTSAASKALWRNPAYKKKMASAVRASFARPEMKQKLADKAREQWKDPEFRAKASRKGAHQSAESRAKVSRSKKGKRLSAETRERMLATRSTPEYRKKLSDRVKAQWQDPEFRVSHPPQKGRRASEETKSKMRAAQLARLTPQERKIRSERMKARWKKDPAKMRTQAMTARWECNTTSRD